MVFKLWYVPSIHILLCPMSMSVLHRFKINRFALNSSHWPKSCAHNSTSFVTFLINTFKNFAPSNMGHKSFKIFLLSFKKQHQFKIRVNVYFGI